MTAPLCWIHILLDELEILFDDNDKEIEIGDKIISSETDKCFGTVIELVPIRLAAIPEFKGLAIVSNQLVDTRSLS